MKRKEVCVIDYGMGNLGSLKNALKYLNTKVTITNKHEVILKSKILFLPGVGSFKKAMNEIKIRKLDKVIHETIKKGHYIFGICLGMQLLGTFLTKKQKIKKSLMSVSILLNLKKVISFFVG